MVRMVNYDQNGEIPKRHDTDVVKPWNLQPLKGYRYRSDGIVQDVKIYRTSTVKNTVRKFCWNQAVASFRSEKVLIN